MNHPITGFNGQRRDAVNPIYHPGNGYRTFQPALMRFSCPDSLSPFGAGGINSYSYCAGDPINRLDPSGHISWQAGLGIAFGMLGMVTAFWTAGAALAAAGSLTAALDSTGAITLITGGSNALADISGTVAALTEQQHPQLAATLGWVSLAAGIVSLGSGLTDGAWQKLSAGSRGLRQRLGQIRQFGLSGGAMAAAEEMTAGMQILSPEERMAIVRDPARMRHEVHQTNVNQMFSRNSRGKITTRLNAEYYPDRWVIWAMNRKPSERFFISDMVEYQYQRIAREQGFSGVMPQRIVQRYVLNTQTRILTDNLQGEELRRVFLSQTPNGKLVQRLADRFGFTITQIELNDFGDYTACTDIRLSLP